MDELLHWKKLLTNNILLGLHSYFLLPFPSASDVVNLLLSLNSKMTMTASFHLIWVFTVELFSTTNRVRVLGEASVVARVVTVAVPYVNDLLVSC